jgi:hypothetical protein
VRHKRIAIWCAVLFAGVFWRAAAPQFTGGLVDLVVFVPPGAALGVTAVWSAHVFTPENYTWRRGFVGAVIGGLVVSPLIAFLVAFAAAWDLALFQFVLNLGALLAVAGGFGAAAVCWMVHRIAAWRLHGSSKKHVVPFGQFRVRRGSARRGRVHAGHHEDAA